MQSYEALIGGCGPERMQVWFESIPYDKVAGLTVTKPYEGECVDRE